jgi:hypothetical protein
MGNDLQTSFIPKQNFTKTATAVASQASVGLLLLVSLIIFGASLVLFAGAYGYHYMLNNEINRPCVTGSDEGCGLRATLEQNKRELQIDRIIGFSRLDAKMKTASSIIAEHRTLIEFFNLLQDETIETIRYTKLDYNIDGVSIEGLARGYEDVAVQAKVFGESELVTEASFSDLGLDKAGNVIFKLNLKVDPDVFNYENVMKTDSLPASPVDTASSSVENTLFPAGDQSIEDITGVPLPNEGSDLFPTSNTNTQ